VNDGYGDYVFVPAGAFKMGDNFGDGESRERPVHTVDLDAFYIGKYEITNGEWRKFRDDAWLRRSEVLAERPRSSERPGAVLDAGQQSRWRDAGQRQLPRSRRQLGFRDRLLQLAQREDGQEVSPPDGSRVGEAARGTDQRRFPWGNTIDHTYANIVGSQRYDTGQLVGYYDGSKRGEMQTRSNASPYGAFDMAGNVMEWCQDWYSRDYYSVSPKKNPKGPATGAYRVVRGGSFFMEGQDQRTYARSARGHLFRVTA
jgi:formylglycine-generating enzyme required for sulfatase activity